MRTLGKSALVLVMLGTLGGVLGPSGAPGQQKDKDKGAVFEVYKDKSDEYRFRFVSGEEKLAIAPHGYKTKEDVMKAIDSIKKEAAKAKVDDQTKK
jgi:uncharacterized protein YegP (UPF0339 family)